MHASSRQLGLFSLLILLCAPPLHGQDDAVTISNESLAELTRLEQELEALETEFDAFDQRLLPTLMAIEEELGRQGRFEEVVRLQNRRLQILRINVGLESPSLLPVLEDSIDTQMRLGAWDEVSDLLDHLRHLQAVNHGESSEPVLDVMSRQADWYLARVALGERSRRADNFLDARDLAEEMLDVAEDRFGEDDPRLVPWLNRRAFTLYQLVQLLNNDNGLAGETIEEVFNRDGSARLQTFRRPGVFDPIPLYGPSSRVPVVEGDEPVGIAYLRQALGFIDDIREIAEATGDAEMQAMATLYHGDYQRLMDHGTAVRDYRDAIEQWRALGISQDRIDRLFARPLAIPHERFFASFDALEDYQRQVLTTNDPPPSDAGVFLGEFTAWHEDLPSTRQPEAFADLGPLPEPDSRVKLAFRINSRGQVSSVDIISAEPDERHARREAWRALREVRFRPWIVDGRAESLEDATIVYRARLDD